MVMNDDDDILKARAPGSRHANAISLCGRIVRSIWSRLSPAHVVTSRGGGSSTTTTVIDTSVLRRRHLNHGRIAGTVVGVCVASALVAFCLYPVIVYLIKRRDRAARPCRHVEAGASLAHHISGSALYPNRRRRLSSAESFKQDEELPRGEPDGGFQSKELEWTQTPIYAGFAQAEKGVLEASGQVSAGATAGEALPRDGEAASVGAVDDDYRNETTPFPFYMPASIPDDNPGVLSGTSHDYYRPSIPSSAFGMVTAPDASKPAQVMPGGRAHKFILKHMFRRLGTRQRSLASGPSAEENPTPLRACPGPESGQSLAPGHPTGFPTESSPTTWSTELPPRVPVSAASPPPAAANQPSPSASQPLVTTPPHIPPSDGAAFRASPSPPSDPAPGTVNPMDIMPASTQSEMCHRTEHQLLTGSYGSGGSPSPASDQAEQEDVRVDSPTISPPPASVPAPTTPAEAHAAPLSPAPTHQEPVQEALQQEPCHHVPMMDPHSSSLDDPSPAVMPETRRLPSDPSDQSTPFPGAQSTAPSAENTPSTQLDSPGSDSMNGSDSRHSISPQPGLTPPRSGGVLRCDEPGCSLVFDQPHKLKYV